ncbi:MAG: DUF951 domain-containing protein [Christensenellaceae bacterium]
MMDFIINDIVTMKKYHPCGSNHWKIIRTGADIKIKCLGCGRIVMLDYTAFIKRVKKVVEHGK